MHEMIQIWWITYWLRVQILEKSKAKAYLATSCCIAPPSRSWWLSLSAVLALWSDDNHLKIFSQKTRVDDAKKWQIFASSIERWETSKSWWVETWPAWHLARAFSSIFDRFMACVVMHFWVKCWLQMLKVIKFLWLFQLMNYLAWSTVGILSKTINSSHKIFEMVLYLMTHRIHV